MNSRLHKPKTFATEAPGGEGRRPQEGYAVLLFLFWLMFEMFEQMCTKKKHIIAHLRLSPDFGAEVTNKAGIVQRVL